MRPVYQFETSSCWEASSLSPQDSDTKHQRRGPCAANADIESDSALWAARQLKVVWSPGRVALISSADGMDVEASPQVVCAPTRDGGKT